MGGSINFGPINDDERSYTFTAPAIATSGDFCIGAIFSLDATRSYARNATRMTIATANAGTTLGGGNDLGITFHEQNHSTASLQMNLRCRIRRGGQEFFAGGLQVGSTALETGKSYVVVMQRRGSAAEVISCELGASKTAVTQISDTINAGWSDPGLGGVTWEIGQSWRNPISVVFAAEDSITAAELEAIAADPTLLKNTGYIPSAARKVYYDLDNDASTIDDDWGAITATQVGTWTAPRTGRIVWDDGSDTIECTSPSFGPFRNFALGPGSSSKTVTVSGTYTGSGYTPGSIEYRILTDAGATTTDWTQISSESIGGGTWSGTMSLPRGGPHYVQFRDGSQTATVWAAGQPVLCGPAVVTIGQSPMEYIEASYPGTLADTVKPILFDRDQLEWGESIGSTSYQGFDGEVGEHGSGYAAANNQHASLTSNARLALLPAALSGSQSKEWAGIQNIVISGASGAFTIGETLTSSGGGSAVVTALSGTDLTVEWSDRLFLNSETLTGQTSGETATVATQEAVATDIASAFPVMIAAIDSAGYGSGDTVWVYWLQGAADVGIDAQDIKDTLDSIRRRMHQEMLTDRGIDYRFVVMPHNRNTAVGSEADHHKVRKAQYEYVVDDDLYNQRVYLGPPVHDMITDGDPSGDSPHPSDAGNQRMGARLGHDIAYRDEQTAIEPHGPTIASIGYPGSGTAITVNLWHASGTNARTPDSGTGAIDVYGFEVSDDGFSTTETISSVTIDDADTLTINLSAEPGSPSTVEVRYLYGEPVPKGDYLNLNDIIYDDTGVGGQGGFPAWPLWDAMSPTLNSVTLTASAANGGQTATVGFSAAVSWSLGNDPTIRIYENTTNNPATAYPVGNPIVVPASASSVTSTTATLSTGTFDSSLYYWIDFDNSGGGVTSGGDPIASATDVAVSFPATAGQRSRTRTRAR